jgi:hypothetical protein
MRIFRQSILFFLLLFLLGTSFYLTPFILIRLKKLDFTHTVLFSIATKNTRSANSEEEKVLQLYTYVCKKIKKPNYKQVYDTTILGFNGQHLYSGLGFCDEQCNTLLSLANTIDIQGRLLFLFGNDSISHHSVCEMKIANHYGMFDPFYKITLRNSNGQIASTEEIIDLPRLLDKTQIPFGISDTDYRDLYGTKYPFKIVKYNKIIQLPDEKKIHAIYASWYAIFGENGRKRLFDYYYSRNKIPQKEQKRIEKLFL